MRAFPCAHLIDSFRKRINKTCWRLHPSSTDPIVGTLYHKKFLQEQAYVNGKFNWHGNFYCHKQCITTFAVRRLVYHRRRHGIVPIMMAKPCIFSWNDSDWNSPLWRWDADTPRAFQSKLAEAHDQQCFIMRTKCVNYWLYEVIFENSLLSQRLTTCRAMLIYAFYGSFKHQEDEVEAKLS